MTTIEINDYEAKLKRIADGVLDANRTKPVQEAIDILEQRMKALSTAARDAVLKVADYFARKDVAFDHVGLTADEAVAWDLIVSKFRCSPEDELL